MQNDDNASNNTNDESVPSTGANMSEMDDELELHTEIEFEPMMSVSNEPREPVSSPDEPEKAHTESIETNKEPDQNANDENDSDEVIVDEVILNYSPEEDFDIFEGVGEEETVPR